MLKSNFKYVLFLFVLTMISCAKKGAVTGGLKDSLAPVLKASFPKNLSTNFKANEIKLTFDEYIKLKNLSKQLIISPPLEHTPEVSPTNATKTLLVRIKDSLKANTTYSFNFGQSIVDNNEGNTLNQFKYVFSTGTYIDSLTLSGTVKDAYDKEVESFVSIMLYEANETFKDSTVYNENPRYITNTLDSLKTFKFENLKAGKYYLVAMKDYNSNNKFDSNKDKIGFKKQFITIPTDSVQELKIFKEATVFKAQRPIQMSPNRIILPYVGKNKDCKITLKKGDTLVPSIVTQFPKKDSLQIWFNHPKLDSLSLSLTKGSYKYDYVVKLKKQKKDTLGFESLKKGDLTFNELFGIKSTTPLTHIDNSKIKFINKDSIAVAFTTKYDEFNQELFFDFKKEPSEKYTIRLFPGALTDIAEQTNDTLVFRTSTKTLEDYGNLKVVLKNVKRFPVILELTNTKGVTIATRYTDKADTKIEFNTLEPNLFSLRLIYDDNNNKEWDSGNYLEKRQAEEIVYFSKEIDVRANWDVEQVFDVSIPYVPEPKKKDNPKGKGLSKPKQISPIDR